MKKTKFEREIESQLKKIADEAKLMHRKEFSYKSFNRKYRSLLKFSKLNEDDFSVSLPNYFPVSIKIEKFDFGLYAILSVRGFDFTYSIKVKYGRDLIEKILQYKLLTVRRYPQYM